MVEIPTISSSELLKAVKFIQKFAAQAPVDPHHLKRRYMSTIVYILTSAVDLYRPNNGFLLIVHSNQIEIHYTKEHLTRIFVEMTTDKTPFV